jgi:hypothetical protein
MDEEMEIRCKEGSTVKCPFCDGVHLVKRDLVASEGNKVPRPGSGGGCWNLFYLHCPFDEEKEMVIAYNPDDGEEGFIIGNGVRVVG